VPHKAGVDEFVRATEFHAIAFAPAFADVGWAVALLALVSPPLRRRARPFLELIGVVAVSSALWCLLLFGPRYTINTTGSYANILLLFVALGCLIGLCRPRVCAAVAAAAVGWFGVFWVLTLPGLGARSYSLLAVGE